MGGGGSRLPLIWAMIAFLVIVKLVEVLKPGIPRKVRQWRLQSKLHQDVPAPE